MKTTSQPGIHPIFGNCEVITVDPGDRVLCDYCNKDYTDSEETGGILIGSYAVCPDCTPRTLESLKEYGEMDNIRAKCPDGVSFRDFVYIIRTS